MIERTKISKKGTNRSVCPYCTDFRCKCIGRIMVCKFCGESEVSYFLNGVFRGTTKFQTVVSNKKEYCGICR